MGVLVRVALVPSLTCYVAAVVVAGVVTALASGAVPGGAPGGLPSLSQALAVGVPLWLAAHLVPLHVGGVPLGVLPLAPALGLAALVALVARSGARRLGGGPTTAGAPVVATAAAAHAVVGVLAAALLTPETLIDTPPALAGVVAGLLAGSAALAGVAGPCGAGRELRRLPSWVRHGMRAGLLTTALLLCAGTTLLLAALVADAPAMAAVLASTTPQAGSGAGLTLLSVLYLPNAVIGATAWVAGPGVTLGLAAAAPTAAVALPSGAMPPIPLLAVMPAGAPPSWAAVTFAVPMAVGSYGGWLLAPTSPDPYRRLRSLLVAGLLAAVLLAVLAVLAGGRAGQGPIDPVVVPVAPLAAAVLGWVLVPGAVVTVLAAPAGPAPVARSRRGAAGAAAGRTSSDRAEFDRAEFDRAKSDRAKSGRGSDEAGGTGETPDTSLEVGTPPRADPV